MITVRRATERHHVRRKRQDAWLTFLPEDHAGPLAGGFGALEILSEDFIPSGAGVWLYSQPEAEIVTYVLEGALAQMDSAGSLGVLRAGEFQRLTAKDGVRHNSKNASRADAAHIFQMWLRPTSTEVDPSSEQRRVPTAERRGVLRLVASPGGRSGSLSLHEDALIYSALLERGQHLAHELGPQRMAWLHVVSGVVRVFDLLLGAGDGAGFTSEPVVSLTTQEPAEILLVDVHGDPVATPGFVAVA